LDKSWDKSIEWRRVILKRNPGAPLPPVVLPKGYSFVSYQDGDERAWGEIEASAGTFERVEDAVAYFRAEFLPCREEVKRRTFFIQTEAGAKVANCTAWWGYTGQRRYPFMRWVSVKSGYQGLGLGKAIIAEGVRRMVEIEGDCVMYIPTQTWSHRAIKLYHWAGFELEMSEPAPGGYKYETAQALLLIEHLI
jgi:GNAT superfamily N-acetyltransferase